MVTRLPTVPAAFEPRIFQPLMSIDAFETLCSSTNSSLPPAGPRVRNSLMTMVVEIALTEVAIGAQRTVKTHRGIQKRNLVMYSSEMPIRTELCRIAYAVIDDVTELSS